MAGQVPTDCEQKQLSVESSAMMLPEDEFCVQDVRLPLRRLRPTKTKPSSWSCAHVDVSADCDFVKELRA